MITNVQSKLVGSDVLVTWEDADTDAIFYDIWLSISAGAYSLLDSVTGDLKTYTHTGGVFATSTYKIQKRTLPLTTPFSGFEGAVPLDIDSVTPMLFTISLTEDTEAGKRLTLPISDDQVYYAHGPYSYNFTVLWGDGESSVITATNDADRIHNYASIGTYKVAIHGLCESFRVDNNAEDRSKYISIDNFTSFIGLKALNFWGCDNLESCSVTLSNVSTITTLFDFMYGCTKITDLPVGIFDGLVNLTNLYRAFRGANLTHLNQGLLDNCTKIEVLAEAFWCPLLFDGAIPDDLLYNLTKLKNTCGVFNGAQTVIPPDFIKYNTKIENAGIFQFSGIIGDIPENFYAYAHDLQSVYQQFMGYTKSTIPANIFANNKHVWDWGGLFMASHIVSIPENFFDNLVPENVEGEVPNFNETFYNCLDFTGNVPALWTKYPTGWEHRNTFFGCVNAANYADIPNDWKGL